MNVVRGGLVRQKEPRNSRNQSMLTSNFNRGNIGFFSSAKITSNANKSLNNKVKYPFDGVSNTTTDTTCTSDNVMGPPSVPIQRSAKKRNTSANNTSLNITSTTDITTQNSGGFLDLSQAKNLWTPKYRQPPSGQVTGSTSRGPMTTSRSRITPDSSTTNTTMTDSCIILALCEGRGAARGEVGLAAIDLRRPSLTLCQLSDKHSYLHSMTALHFFNPVEIVVPSTFCDNSPTELYRVVKQNLSNIPLTAIQRRHFSDTQGLHYIKHLCAPEYASVQLQLMHKFYALTAAAAVLKYVEYIQCVVFQEKSLKIQYHCSKNYTWIDVETAIRLELVESLSGSYERGSSLLSILNQASTAGGVRALRATILQPPCDANAIKDRADAVQELLDNSQGLLPGLQNVMKQLYDVDKILWLCTDLPSQGGTRSGEAQLNHTILLKNTMDLVPALLAVLELANSKWFITVRKDMENPKFVEISDKIKRVIHDGAQVAHGRDAQQHRCFAVKPEINGLLDVARRSYSELISDIQERVEELIRTYSLPLRLCKNATRGFHIGMTVGAKNKRTFNVADLPPIFLEVQNHASSITMTTEDVALLDQQANEALNEIQTMSNIVIFGLLTELRPYMSALYKLCEHVAELDIVMSLAQASSSGHYVRPVFGEHLEVKDSIHPMLDYVLPVSTVPNDIFASPEYNFHIITGPNMGGKTIYIKQIALLQIMAQIGCYVPATSAIFRICDKIFTRIGFNDSIECNASTYILEMKEIHHILQTITPRSLVIIDELCRGTSSEEGTSMSWAICEQLLNTKAFTFFTTHFLYLTRLHDLYFNVVNLHLTADEVSGPTNSDIKQLIYKHKVRPGVTTLEHYGLTLASNTNLPNTVVSLARELAQVISSQKKPIPPGEEKCREDTLFYKLGADLLMEMRKPTSTDQTINDIVKEFKENNANIIADLVTEQQTNSHDDKNNKDNMEMEESCNTIQNSQKDISQEDPFMFFNQIQSIDHHSNQMNNSQVILKVSRSSNSKYSTPNRNQATESVTMTPIQNARAVRSKNVIIDESDVNSTINRVNDYLVVEIIEPEEGVREKNDFSRFLSQPSTSKGFEGNFFKTPQPFHFKQNKFPQNQTTPTITNTNTNRNKPEKVFFSFESEMTDEDDELLSQVDENSPQTIHNKQFYDFENRACKKSVNNIPLKQHCAMNATPRDKYNTDDLTGQMTNIFGSEQCIPDKYFTSQIMGNGAGTEELEKMLRDVEQYNVVDEEMTSQSDDESLY